MRWKIIIITLLILAFTKQPTVEGYVKCKTATIKVTTTTKLKCYCDFFSTFPQYKIKTNTYNAILKQNKKQKEFLTNLINKIEVKEIKNKLIDLQNAIETENIEHYKKELRELKKIYKTLSPTEKIKVKYTILLQLNS